MASMPPTPQSARGKKKEEKEEPLPVVNVPTILNRADDFFDDEQALQIVRKLFESRPKVRQALQPMMQQPQQLFFRLNSQMKKKCEEVSALSEKDKGDQARRMEAVEADREALRKESKDLHREVQNREKSLWRAEQNLHLFSLKLAAQEKELNELRRLKKEVQSRRRSPSPTPRAKTPRPIADAENKKPKSEVS